MKEQTNFNSQGLFDSSAEKITYEYLQKLINMEDYDIFPHQSILDTFKKVKRVAEFKDLYKNYCYAIYKPEMDEKMAELCHFDFVIYDKEFHVPHVIIEVNGRKHLTDPAKAHIDLFKQFITTHIFGRPFIELDSSSTWSDENILHFLKDKFFYEGLKNPYSRPVFCTQCSRKMFYRENGDFYYCTSCINTKDNPLTRSAYKIPQIIKDDIDINEKEENLLHDFRILSEEEQSDVEEFVKFKLYKLNK